MFLRRSAETQAGWSSAWRAGKDRRADRSGNLVQTLLRAGLVDEWQLLTFPVVLGQGKRLFGDGVVPSRCDSWTRPSRPPEWW